MTSHPLSFRATTMKWAAAVGILMSAWSCDTFGPEPKPLPLPAVPETPTAPTTPNPPSSPTVPEVPEGPMVPITRGQIVFVDPWEDAIFIADSTGRRVQRVSQSSGARDLAVSADGMNIAFSRDCNESSHRCSHIYLMSAGGSDLVLLQTGDSLDHPAQPAWSPDGKQIAFVQGRLISPQDAWSHIYTINKDGTGVIQITHSGYNDWPAWSPDGSRIILARAEGDPLAGLSHGIFEVYPDGSNVRRLRYGPVDGRLTWSPDGSRIAFVGFNREDFEVNLFVMNADGSNVTVLQSGLDRVLVERPAWSPDGNSITFAVISAARMCEDIWDLGMVACGQSAKRVSLDRVIDSAWELPSASRIAWQR